MATTIMKKLWWECLMTLLLRNMFISLLSLEKGQEEKLLFKVKNGTARTKTQHHLWTMNIVKTALTRNANQGLSGDESFFSLLLNTVFYFVLKVIFLKKREDFILGRNCPLLYLYTGFAGCFLRVEINGLFLLFIFLFLNELCNTLLDG